MSFQSFTKIFLPTPPFSLIIISRMSPNRIFMFLINPPGGNVRIQKLIAKHIFECFEKRKEEDGKSKYCNLFVSFSYLEISCSRYTIYCVRLQINMSVKKHKSLIRCTINKAHHNSLSLTKPITSIKN